MEQRDGDRTVGKYYVLLPDGRKQVSFLMEKFQSITKYKNHFFFHFQIVNYEADQNGYRPTITYEDTNANGANGGPYGNGPANGGYNGGNNGNGQFNGY